MKALLRANDVVILPCAPRHDLRLVEAYKAKTTVVNERTMAAASPASTLELS